MLKSRITVVNKEVEKMSETSFLAKAWSYKKKKNLPNSSFAYVDPQGKGHFPYKDENGKIDEPHLNSAFSYLPNSHFSPAIKHKIHTKLMNACKQLGKPHGKCSIPGCQGYEPSKKSFLEDVVSFKALTAEAAFQSEWTTFDEQRKKGTEKTKSTTSKTEKTKTTKTTKTTKPKTEKTKTKKPKVEKKKEEVKKSFLEDSAGFFALVQEKRNQPLVF